MNEGDVAAQVAALRAELAEFRDREFKDMAERNDKAHDRIEIEVKRVNGDGTQAFRLWRAEFTGQMKGAAGSGKVVWAAIAVTAGPLTAIVMKLLEK